MFVYSDVSLTVTYYISLIPQVYTCVNICVVGIFI